MLSVSGVSSCETLRRSRGFVGPRPVWRHRGATTWSLATARSTQQARPKVTPVSASSSFVSQPTHCARSGSAPDRARPGPANGAAGPPALRPGRPSRRQGERVLRLLSIVARMFGRIRPGGPSGPVAARRPSLGLSGLLGNCRVRPSRTGAPGPEGSPGTAYVGEHAHERRSAVGHERTPEYTADAVGFAGSTTGSWHVLRFPELTSIAVTRT